MVFICTPGARRTQATLSQTYNISSLANSTLQSRSYRPALLGPAIEPGMESDLSPAICARNGEVGQKMVVRWVILLRA